MSLGRSDDEQPILDPGSAHAFPCTPLQERLWTQHRLGRSGGLNIAMRWLVNGRLSGAAAQGALQCLVERHEILRTRFGEVDGRLVQTVLPTCAIRLRDIDLAFLGADERTQRAEEIARAEAMEPMDPKQAPLLRATLIRLDAACSMLLLTFHALAADGWSTGLVVREFSAAAKAIEAGATPDTSAPDLQFADYALWQRELLAGDSLEEARAYWRQELTHAAGTRLPPDRRAGENAGQPNEIVSLLLPAELSRASDAFARRHNATLYSLSAAALALLLHRATGESEIVMGSQVANREEAVAEQLVGPTVNSITLRLPVDGDVEVGDFVRAVAGRCREALQHERLPFEVALGFAPGADARALHAVNLVVHRSYSGIADTEEPGGFSLVSLPSYSSGTQWDLNFYLIGRDEGWRMSCEADARLYTPETARTLLETWRRCLEAIVAAPDRRLADCLATGSGAVADGQIPVRSPARQVVRFNERGASTPLIVLNNRSIYYQLARQLGEDRPLIDVLLYHRDGAIDLRSCVFEDFAAYAVKLIRWAQPRGPYVLGGHCVYGVLAFEAARQLQRAGEKVELVALFDSWAPGYRETMSPRDQKLRHYQLQLHHYADRLRQYRRGEIGLNELVRKPILYRLGLLPPEPVAAPAELEGQWFDSYAYDTVARFRPAPYDGDVVLFRSNDPLRGRLFDERMGWGPLVSGTLRKVDVDGGHFDMFRERPAGEIAAALRAILGDTKER